MVWLSSTAEETSLVLHYAPSTLCGLRAKAPLPGSEGNIALGTENILVYLSICK